MALNKYFYFKERKRQEEERKRVEEEQKLREEQEKRQKERQDIRNANLVAAAGQRPSKFQTGFYLN